MLYALLQLVVLSLALLASLWQFWGKLAPQSRALVQQRLALALMSPNCPQLLNRMGFKLLPQVTSACGTGCNSCGVCPSS